MVYDLKYGTLRDLIENNKFNPHETNCSRAIIELCGTFNEVVNKSCKPRHIVSVLLDYKDRKPNKLSETTVDNLERVCLVMYDKFGGGFQLYKQRKPFGKWKNTLPCRLGEKCKIGRFKQMAVFRTWWY